MDVVKEMIVIGAVVLLLSSLWPVRRLVLRLPAGSVRRSWHWLAVLLLIVIGGFLAYFAGLIGDSRVAVELVVPALMFAASWFIFVVCLLSASGIDSARRLIELERQCITDGLTGIYNRRHFDAELQKEYQRALRYGQPMAVMLVDIDHFKQVNDGFGHQVGDDVLRGVCRQIQHLSRAADVVARYGGEEIAVIAPNTSLEQARVQAERLRNAILLADFGSECDQVLRVTVSIGVAQIDASDAGELEAFIRRADNALYEAKRQGRNRVETSTANVLASRVTDLRSWLAAKKKSGRAA